MRQFLKNFVANENGATAIEYALIAALISVVCIGAWQTIGNNMNTTFGTIGSSLATPA